MAQLIEEAMWLSEQAKALLEQKKLEDCHEHLELLNLVLADLRAQEPPLSGPLFPDRPEKDEPESFYCNPSPCLKTMQRRYHRLPRRYPKLSEAEAREMAQEVKQQLDNGELRPIKEPVQPSGNIPHSRKSTTDEF